MGLVQIQLRRGLAAAWIARNPILAPAELGVETDTEAFKVGDGITPWVNLAYQNAQSSYNVSQIIGAAPLDAPLFTGDAQLANPPLIGDYDQSIPTTQWVVDTITAAIAGLSAPGALPTNTSLPVATLTGTTATVNVGTWTGSPTFVYNWARSLNANGSAAVNISVAGSGFNTPTYTIQPSDVGFYLVCVVTATNSSGSAPPVTSKASGQVVGTTAPPTVTANPVITGTTTVGQTLTTTTGTWTGAPTSFIYQWAYVLPGQTGAGTLIAGATASTYVLQASDVGHQLYTVVKAINAGGAANAYSAGTATVVVAGGGGGGGPGTLVLDGTFASGTLPAAVYTHQSFVAGHVTVVADPDGTGVKVARFAIADADAPYAGAFARGDVATTAVLTSGTTRYAAMPIKFQTVTGIGLYAGSGTSFLQFCEAKDTGASFPSWGLGLLNVGGVNHFFMGLDPTYGNVWIGPPADTAWHCPTVVGYYTGSSTGWLQLYWDGVLQTFNVGSYNGSQKITGIPTINPDSNGTLQTAWPVDINSYRSHLTYTGTLVSYHGPVKIGTTLAAVLPESGRVQGP